MSKTRKNFINLSGGKDSTATLLLALERGTECEAVFCDTGHEHPETYEYVRYLEHATGVPVRWVSASFKARIAAKREYIVRHWAADGVPQSRIDRALEVLVPTGNPFLDLCMWKGRFPSPKARFCTDELKVGPFMRQAVFPALRDFDQVWSWVGVRRDESRARANARRFERGDAPGYFIFRPIVTWTAHDCFAMHSRHGIKWNPLYEQGMGRVGCMPCIMARKDELAQLAARFPEEVERVRVWERLVSEAAKRGSSTLLDTRNLVGKHASEAERAAVHYTTHGIDAALNWSQHDRKGQPREDIEGTMCTSQYGLCE